MSYMDMTARQIERDEAEKRRDDTIDCIASQIFSSDRHAILIGDKSKAVDVAEMLADLLCSNPVESANFVRVALNGDLLELGRLAASLIERVMRNDADNKAAREVDEMENDAKITLAVKSCAN